MAAPSETKTKHYHCPVFLLADEDGGFSICGATFPGACSQGDTEEEALTNIIEAMEGLILSYQEEGRVVPWLPEPVLPDEWEGAYLKWVEFDV